MVCLIVYFTAKITALKWNSKKQAYILFFDLQVGHNLETFNNCYQMAAAFWNGYILLVKRQYRGLNQHALVM